MNKVISGININKNGELLLVRKINTRILPGGKIDNDETDEECLKREFLEELFVENKYIKGIQPYKLFQGTTPHSKKLIKCMTYSIDLDGATIIPSNEILEAKYTNNFNSLNISPITQDIIETLQKDGYL